MVEAKVFKSGNSQAIRLPKEYRFSSDTVRINKIGNVLVIIPDDDPWANFREGIEEAENFTVPDNSRLKLKKIRVS